jgi:hypothetical protein
MKRREFHFAGARPKDTVRDIDQILWLAKFPSPKDRFAVPVIEAGIRG